MLADPRATDALVNDFAAQWLNLRRVAEVVVDPERCPNFDESLLEAFKRETELFVADTLREDRSVVDLLNANHTFVNERLARHYGIPGVYGSRFRRVRLPNHDQRGGCSHRGRCLRKRRLADSRRRQGERRDRSWRYAALVGESERKRGHGPSSAGSGGEPERGAPTWRDAANDGGSLGLP